ncbi:MAG: sodium:solute symporter family protein, partial [Bacteroidia bacterium]
GEAAFLRGFKSIYLGLFMNVLIIGWVNLALMTLLKVFFGIPDEQLLWYAFAGMLITAFYSSLSGIWGVAVTDVFQFTIAMIGTIILAFIVVGSDQVGGMTGLKAQLPEWSMSFFPNIGASASAGDVATTLTISAGAFLAFIGIQWWASWYPGAEPGGGGYVVQRMLSTRSEKDAIFATLFFQIAHYCIRPWPWILVGLASLILYPELGPDEKRLGYVMAMKDFLPVGLRGLLLVAFFAAYMSTISTQLNWGASYIVNDFYHRFIDKSAEQKQLVTVSRITTFLLMIIALFATSQMKTISGVWEFIIECGAGLGLVLILRWYWWRINAWSEITAMIAPFFAYTFAKFVLDPALVFPYSYFLTVGFTTLVWIFVTYLTKPTSADKLQDFYNRVKPDGWWRPVEGLMGREKLPTKIPYLAICWISAVTMTYSILFFTGKVIFMEWLDAALWLVVASVSFLILRKYISRTRVFSN